MRVVRNFRYKIRSRLLRIISRANPQRGAFYERGLSSIYFAENMSVPLWGIRPSSQIVQPISGSSNDTQEDVDDSSLVLRLIEAYRRADKEHDNRGSGMWQSFFDLYHQESHLMFKEGEPSKVATILRDPSSSNLFYGFDNLCSLFLEKINSPDAQPVNSLFYLAGLIRFAEMLGAIRLNNPEQYYEEPPWATEAVIKRIEQKLGTIISFPNPFPNEFGAKTSRGVVTYRAVQALYQAWRIKKIVKDIPKPSILEIGGGLGRTAYYARAFGILDYTLIDLPITSISQGYFLGRTLGEDNVLLLGENEPDADSRIKVFSPNSFLNGDDEYDLIVNVDSLTEMDPAIARAYWARIETATGKLLSINHEAGPFTVKELIDGSENVARAERQLYPMRAGYLEELVCF